MKKRKKNPVKATGKTVGSKYLQRVTFFRFNYLKLKLLRVKYSASKILI